jgi:hypothetical protein
MSAFLVRSCWYKNFEKLIFLEVAAKEMGKGKGTNIKALY